MCALRPAEPSSGGQVVVLRLVLLEPRTAPLSAVIRITPVTTREMRQSSSSCHLLSGIGDSKFRGPDSVPVLSKPAYGKEGGSGVRGWHSVLRTLKK